MMVCENNASADPYFALLGSSNSGAPRIQCVVVVLLVLIQTWALLFRPSRLFSRRSENARTPRFGSNSNVRTDAAPQAAIEVFDLPALAQTHSLTNYDAAYLSLALRLRLPLATSDVALRRAATAAAVQIF